jgi:hypothetical protein
MFIDELSHRERVHVEEILAKIRAAQARQDFREFHSIMEVLKALVDEENLNEREKMALIELLIV